MKTDKTHLINVTTWVKKKDKEREMVNGSESFFGIISMSSFFFNLKL